MRDRHEASPAAGTELDDPTVVDARVLLCELQVLALCLPEDTERRVEDREIEVLAVEPLEPLRRIPRAEARVVEIAEPGALPSRRCQDATDEIHRPETLRQVSPDHLRRTARDLEVLAPLFVAADAHRPVAKARLEPLVPEVRRLEHVSVGVDRSVVWKSRQHALP